MHDTQLPVHGAQDVGEEPNTGPVGGGPLLQTVQLVKLHCEHIDPHGEQVDDVRKYPLKHFVQTVELEQLLQPVEQLAGGGAAVVLAACAAVTQLEIKIRTRNVQR